MSDKTFARCIIAIVVCEVLLAVALILF